MSTNSNDRGRAYEYAWIRTLYKELVKIRNTEIVKNQSWQTNEKSWSSMDETMKDIFWISADSAIATILELEPLTTENDKDVLLLEFQKDNAGMLGDVRDILIKRDSINWEIGLSCKHNHEAVKHSRLSHCLDFGKEWFNHPCSKEYWDNVKPVFDKLKEEKNKGTKWSELKNKEDEVYLPILQAFMNEIKSSFDDNKSLPKKMVEYLIGVKDYYKVISSDNERLTLIRTFNIHKTLNKASKVKVSAIFVPPVNLPTELVAIKLKKGSKTTVEMYLNEGWQLSFRIHNASTEVEPSLKFDIQFEGTPNSVGSIVCRWK